MGQNISHEQRAYLAAVVQTLKANWYHWLDAEGGKHIFTPASEATDDAVLTQLAVETRFSIKQIVDFAINTRSEDPARVVSRDVRRKAAIDHADLANMEPLFVHRILRQSSSMGTLCAKVTIRGFICKVDGSNTLCKVGLKGTIYPTDRGYRIRAAEDGGFGLEIAALHEAMESHGNMMHLFDRFSPRLYHDLLSVVKEARLPITVKEQLCEIIADTATTHPNDDPELIESELLPALRSRLLPHSTGPAAAPVDVMVTPPRGGIEMTDRAALTPFSPSYPPERESEARLLLRQMVTIFNTHKIPASPRLAPRDAARRMRALVDIGKQILRETEPTLLFMRHTRYPASAPRPRRTLGASVIHRPRGSRRQQPPDLSGLYSTSTSTPTTPIRPHTDSTRFWTP